MRNIIVECMRETPVAEHLVEIVERKGVGHPDYICDAIMEDISISLSREYIKRFGKVMHHNVDKGLLVAGKVKNKFGGGSVLEPMTIIIGDRATFEVEGERLSVEEIAIGAAKDWFRKNLRFLDPEEHVRYEVVLKPGSPELVDIFLRRRGLLGANDTSAAVGYAPLSETERLVLETERFLNSPPFKERFPASGEDVKVMGFRGDKKLHLTIAMPQIDRFVDSEESYFRRKDEMQEALEEFANGKKSSLERAYIYLNTLDKKGRGMGGMYLSVLGTSAEDADSGEVGRGNRVNGVIALNRPMGTEAAAGKNPVSHVGKIYNILTHKIANEIYQGVPGVREVYVWLCSQIGAPIDQPKIASAQLILEPGVLFDSTSKKVKEIMDGRLANIGKFCEELVQGKYPVC
ncbi:MAG TPA: S-adenosylmethionine synthetase [Actinobacteria bacterium]|nr:S-adenosylmethionine synthetase [Actinomycetota bacterium]